MGKHSLTGQRLMAICLIGCLALNYPLLSIFSTDRLIGGIPVLYVYLFVGWLVLIVGMALIIEGRR